MTNEEATLILFVVGAVGFGLTEWLMHLMKGTSDSFKIVVEDSKNNLEFGPVLGTLWVLWHFLGLLIVVVIRLTSVVFLAVALVGVLNTISELGWLP